MENLVSEIEYLRMENKEQKKLIKNLNKEAAKTVQTCETITNHNQIKAESYKNFLAWQKVQLHPKIYARNGDVRRFNKEVMASKLADLTKRRLIDFFTV